MLDPGQSIQAPAMARKRLIRIANSNQIKLFGRRSAQKPTPVIPQKRRKTADHVLTTFIANDADWMTYSASEAYCERKRLAEKYFDEFGLS